jgi:hypothetical protein
MISLFGTITGRGYLSLYVIIAVDLLKRVTVMSRYGVQVLRLLKQISVGEDPTEQDTRLSFQRGLVTW